MSTQDASRAGRGDIGQDTTVEHAPADAAAGVGAVLGAAYYRTDLGRWLVPELAARRQILPLWVGLHVDVALLLDLVDRTADRRAVAVWLPGPALELPGWWERLAETAGAYGERFEALHRALADVQVPQEPYRQLVHAGVDPDRQRRGLGRALLRRRLDQLDEQHLPALAVAIDDRSRHWLAEHRFRPHSTPVLYARDCPPLQPMWRQPATARRHRR